MNFSDSHHISCFSIISNLLSVDPEIGVVSKPDLSGAESLDGDGLDGSLIKRETEVGVKIIIFDDSWIIFQLKRFLWFFN